MTAQVGGIPVTFVPNESLVYVDNEDIEIIIITRKITIAVRKFWKVPIDYVRILYLKTYPRFKYR
mgnify:CR=1 FL=1